MNHGLALNETINAVYFTSLTAITTDPWPNTAQAMFFGLSLKSRVFSPLDNSRPDRDAAVKGEATRGFGDRIMPSWTPPGWE